jgi:uncharacterized protein YxeA
MVISLWVNIPFITYRLFGGKKMDNKIILLVVIALIVVVGAFYALQNNININTTPNISSNTTNTTNITDITHNATEGIHNETEHNYTKNETANVKISAKEAQKIAIEGSTDLGFPAKPHGTPTLFKWTENNRHTWVWKVPLEFLAGNVKYGHIYVDAMNGEIIMNE